MPLVNHTWFPAMAFQGVAPDGAGFHVAVLRQSFSFAHGALDFAPEQSPLCLAEVFAGEPNQSSVLAESDLCPFKPRCDVLVDATAHAPGGRAARSFPVRLRVLPGRERPDQPALVDKTLLVSGPSQFRKRRLPIRLFWFLVKLATLGAVRRNPWKRTRPEPILALPVRYEHAFGGGAKLLCSHRRAARVHRRHWLPGADLKALLAAFQATGEAAPLAWRVFEPNPLGQGFAPAWWLKGTRTRAVPAPQIEAPGAPVTARRFLRCLRGKPLDHPAYRPRGLGILDMAWTPRRHLAGTVDQAWAESGRLLPGDFDFAIWNGAPPDQQPPGLLGDEVLELTNLCPPDTPGLEQGPGGSVLRLELPGHLPYVLVHYAEGSLAPVPLDLDTLQLDPERRSLVLVWRAVLPLEPEVSQLEARMVRREDKAAWLARGGPEVCHG